jgi:glycosyltransferase involved in cell wall biosynthesis
MKFCMLTTFFGPHSFGGDAAYVDRLSRALARRGHEVHVIYCVDAFEAVRGEHPERSYEPCAGVTLHPLRSRWGLLSPLSTQVTGRPALKKQAIREILDHVRPDVIHFHNISLIGGPDLLRMGQGAVRFMTAHEHWLHCANHLLWKNDEKSCDSRQCLSCVIRARRPPQYWRKTGLVERSLGYLDRLIFPTHDALERHRSIESAVPRTVLPYFLPDDWSGGIELSPRNVGKRPYLAAAGRLVKMKGFQNLMPIMARLPGIDLKIAGTGPFEAELKRLAGNARNIEFVGLCDRKQLTRLFRDAEAVVVPSLFPETFGYVVSEAFAVKTPVIVNRGGGAIVETGELSGGGIGYDNPDQLEAAILSLVHDRNLRDRLAGRGYSVHRHDWSESSHLERYFGMIEDARTAHVNNDPSRHRRPHFVDRRIGSATGSINIAESSEPSGKLA